MEPIAALSLASNVIQVVDFSARIVSKSIEPYKSYDGQLVQHRDIATASADLERLTTRLSESLASPSLPIVLSEDEHALYVLCQGCIGISRQLQHGLNTLKVNGAPSKWKSLRKALKSIWSKERIAEFQSRLALYRDELDTRIVLRIKTKIDLVTVRQSDRFDQLDISLKTLIQALLDSSASGELKIDQRAAVTDAAAEANIQLARRNIAEAVEGASGA